MSILSKLFTDCIIYSTHVILSLNLLIVAIEFFYIQVSKLYLSVRRPDALLATSVCVPRLYFLNVKIVVHHFNYMHLLINSETRLLVTLDLYMCYREESLEYGSTTSGQRRHSLPLPTFPLARSTIHPLDPNYVVIRLWTLLVINFVWYSPEKYYPRPCFGQY